jgi:hypothetical protein
VFLRRYERRCGGRKRTYWALVESLRTGRGSRQRVVAYLGELARSEQSGWAELGRNLSGKQRPSPSLFDPPHYDNPSDEEPVLVNLRGDRLEAALKKMQASAESGRLKDEAVAIRRLGRLMCQYWRAGGAFDVKIERLGPPPGKARLRVTWARNDRWNTWAALSEGCYLLRTNLNETDPATLWKRYIQLTEAEWAFRITKNELEIRPIWHQKTDRVLAHILVCFLAYVLWKTLGQWMRRSGLDDAPRTVLEELAKIKSGDVLLPTGTKEGRYNGTVRLRYVTEPDEAQKVLLHRLGITLPRRLRRIDEFVQM